MGSKENTQFQKPYRKIFHEHFLSFSGSKTKDKKLKISHFFVTHEQNSETHFINMEKFLCFLRSFLVNIVSPKLFYSSFRSQDLSGFNDPKLQRLLKHAFQDMAICRDGRILLGFSKTFIRC